MLSYVTLPAVLRINKYMWLMFYLLFRFLFFSYFNFLLRTRTGVQLLVYHDWYTYYSLRNQRHIKVRHDHFLRRHIQFNPLNAELNPICHFLALLGAHYIFHLSGLRVKHFAVRLYVFREAPLLKSVKKGNKWDNRQISFKVTQVVQLKHQC